MGEVFSPIPQPQDNNVESSGLNLDSKISPSIILIIIILAIIFFVSGLLHLLVRYLLRPNERDPDELPDNSNNLTALQGQLQQLFHLHDSGVDQSYIDTLPVFQYKAIIGVKDPFDCAVCLCEFETEDKLRLLPKCSHAFHMDCIDTWLLSHSTCPLCRASLLFHDFGAHFGNGLGFGLGVGLAPVVCVLESGSNTVESSMELERESGSGFGPQLEEAGFGLGFGSQRSDVGVREEVGKKEDKIVTVKLGKFRSVEGDEGSSEINYNNNNNVSDNNSVQNGGVSSNELGSRRCYSMGSFAYILDETTSLQVPIRTPMKKEKTIAKKGSYLKEGGHRRGAMSEYGGCGESMRELNGIDGFRGIEKGNHESSSCKKESFSISKIWSRGGDKKGKGNGNGIEVDQSSRRTISEFEIDVSELGNDEETQSCYSVDSFANPNATTSSSSTRRTLLWLMGRQNNKIVHDHSSFSSNV